MPAFWLHVGSDRIATLTFDHPEHRVNLFDTRVLAELTETLQDLSRRDDIACLVLLSGKNTTFIAGADLDEIEWVEDTAIAASVSRQGQEAFAYWEALPFPTISAIRGACMGGGTELSLASTHIVVSDRPDLRIGLPEVNIGIVPGWGGCVRLPRRVGIAAALELILGARGVDGRKALRIGLADAVLPDAGFLAHVARFARTVADHPRPLDPRRRTRQWIERTAVGRRVVFDRARRQALQTTGGRYPAPLRAIEVVRIGLEQGRAAGFEAEARAISDLATSSECKCLIRLFRSLERAKKPQIVGVPGLPVRRPAVIGAGVMGTAIAHRLTNRANLPVRLVDSDHRALGVSRQRLHRHLRSEVERGRMSEPEARRQLALTRSRPGSFVEGRYDIVIESVDERLEVKRDLLAGLAATLPATCLLASNTSALSIDDLATSVPDPSRLLGMHFLHPVDEKKLVEVVVGSRTSDAAVQAALDLARRMDLTAILVQDGPGFLVNRLLGVYWVEALWLAAEGIPLPDIDAAMTAWGMAPGPFRQLDAVGLDIAVEILRTLQAAFDSRLPMPPGTLDLAHSGDLGRKTGTGFYRYAGRHREEPSPHLDDLLRGATRPTVAAPSELVDRLVLRMVDEAARCLADGVVDRPWQIDLALVLGAGFPPFRGGLCRWADSFGVAQAVRALERLSAAVALRFQPGEALRAVAERGGFVSAGPR